MLKQKFDPEGQPTRKTARVTAADTDAKPNLDTHAPTAHFDSARFTSMLALKHSRALGVPVRADVRDVGGANLKGKVPPVGVARGAGGLRTGAEVDGGVRVAWQER